MKPIMSAILATEDQVCESMPDYPRNSLINERGGSVELSTFLTPIFLVKTNQTRRYNSHS